MSKFEKLVRKGPIKMTVDHFLNGSVLNSGLILNRFEKAGTVKDLKGQ